MERVAVPVRRPVSAWEDVPDVVPVRVDFDDLARDAALWSGDQVFLCLGTTMRKAGSRGAFRRVDLQLTVEAARLAQEHGARDAFLVSSAGADPASRNFYLRTKGEAEDALASLPFRSVHAVRPSLLTGDRTEVRPAERIGTWVSSLLAPLLVGRLRRYRPIPAEVVARAMLRRSREPGEGWFVHESEELRESASVG